MNTRSMKVVNDIDCEKVWMGPEINHGDFPFRIFLKLLYTDHYDSEWARTEGKYHYELHVVSVQQAGEVNLRHAFASGRGLENFADATDADKYCELLHYGISACVWQQTFNNFQKGLKAANNQLRAIDILFGVYMDRPLNGMGATGWDFVRGNLNGPHEAAINEARAARKVQDERTNSSS